MAVKKSVGAQSAGYGRIGCDMELYNDCAEIANKCNLTLTSVVNSLLRYALDHSELVVEEKVVEVGVFKIDGRVLSNEREN